MNTDRRAPLPEWHVDKAGMKVRYSTDLLTWQTTALEGLLPPSLPTPPPGYEYANFLLPPSVIANSKQAFMRVRLSVH